MKRATQQLSDDILVLDNGAFVLWKYRGHTEFFLTPWITSSQRTRELVRWKQSLSPTIRCPLVEFLNLLTAISRSKSYWRKKTTFVFLLRNINPTTHHHQGAARRDLLLDTPKKINLLGIVDCNPEKEVLHAHACSEEEGAKVGNNVASLGKLKPS